MNILPVAFIAFLAPEIIQFIIWIRFLFMPWTQLPEIKYRIALIVSLSMQFAPFGLLATLSQLKALTNQEDLGIFIILSMVFIYTAGNLLFLLFYLSFECGLVKERMFLIVNRCWFWWNILSFVFIFYIQLYVYSHAKYL